MTTANQVAQQWWTAIEVIHIFPDDAAIQQFLAWLKQFALGREPVAHLPGFTRGFDFCEPLRLGS